MSLQVFTSNRMENLAETLAGILKIPLASPFESETIVVQSKGMQRWLAMELARRMGVSANCSYPFPNAAIWQFFCRAFAGLPDTSLLSPEVMTWKIMGLFAQFLDRAEFASLAGYLDGDHDDRKRFQLAGKIADTFDQYTLFRPEMLAEWEAGEGGDWQAILWRELARFGNRQHRGHLKQEYIALAADRRLAGKDLPARISIFGISYLPKYHMDVFAAAARFTDIYLFLLSPSRRYWGGTKSARSREVAGSEERDRPVEGNPLLASLGKLGRDFAAMILDAGDVVTARTDLSSDPGRKEMLTSIQSDILNLRGGADGKQKRVIAADDLSVQIHSCHSPMREVEVLHDNLLALLDRGNGLSPRDIVVMTPDIETYAPYISTVFEGFQDPAVKIPYSIADRSLPSEGCVAGVLLRLLGLPGSRLPVTLLFDILESDPVRKRFDFDGEEIQTIRRWFEETRVRWGLDEDHRARLGFPAYRENSLYAGLDRLLLGYAMPDEDGKLFQGVLPYDELEGEDAHTLGNFADFVRKVAAMSDRLARPRILGEWRTEIQALLADFIEADDSSAHELSAVAGVLETLGELGEKSGYSGTVELGVVRSWLETRLAREERGLGFMTGGVTFCAMLPMRSIPFRVVALIGMNDNSFPRQGRPPGFDLVARNPRRGDRSLRDEDRYLFLECILSARENLYISYVGQSIKDNSEIPPSVLVSEFLDAIKSGHTSGEIDLEKRLLTTHRLQAFSRSYFDRSSALFSYSGENCAALLDAKLHPWQPVEFLAAPLKPPADEWKDIPLSRLIRFFDNPARFFLENRLGVRLEDTAAPLEDREAFALDSLEEYSLKQGILETCMTGGSLEQFLLAARGRGILPPARHGESVFNSALEEIDEFASRIRGKTGGIPALEPMHFELPVGEFMLRGRLDGLWQDHKIRYRPATPKAKDQVRTWVEHLVLNACRPEGGPRKSLLMMSDSVISFAPVDNPGDILAALLVLYWQGLTAPLRFLPKSAMAYAKDLKWSLDQARKEWEGSDWTSGEREDAHLHLCFREEDPLTEEFEDVSKSVLEPLVRHRMEE